MVTKIGVKLFVFVLFFLAPLSSVMAFDVKNHKGSYVYAMVGMMDLSHDTNARTNQNFGSDIELGYGLTYGHNITNWIAPELQFNYSTSKGTTPSGSGREHALTIRLNSKFSFLTSQQIEKDRVWRFYPYAKVGGLAHALYVNAPNADDKVGAWGAGFGLGGGLEINMKALYLGLDISNDIVFLQDDNRTIGGQNTKILDGGTDYQFSTMAAIGVHF